MQCPKCQIENPEGKKFCCECGSNLILAFSKCSSEILPSDKFCSACSYDLKNAPFDASDKRTDQKPLEEEKPTFDDLYRCDLESVYEQGREEVLRDHAFRILLERCDTIEKLEKLAFDGARGLAGWTTKELIEITNHFRLLSSPENEIRIYRECRDKVFRSAPRVREFYLLALNKIGRPLETIQESKRIIAEGGQNALVWSILGESYSSRMIFAEQIASELAEAKGEPFTIDPRLLACLPHYFPEMDTDNMTVAFAQALRQKNLHLATRIFRRGFRESGSSYAGLGWMLRTIDYLLSLKIEQGQLLHEHGVGGLDSGKKLNLKLAEREIQSVERELDSQIALIGIALELQGGSESLDYWTHAGQLLLSVAQGDVTRIPLDMARLFTAADAEFKLAITTKEMLRIRNNCQTIRPVELAGGRSTALLDLRIKCADMAIAELEAGCSRLRAAAVKKRGAALNEEYRRLIDCKPANRVNVFLNKTINFCALTSNLIPVRIDGAIGRIGARVPDLLINRHVQDDLASILEMEVLQPMLLEKREDPKSIIEAIQKIVGNGFKIADLQDLLSPTHAAFDIRSDGLIALSGVDYGMRRHARTGTDLTATLLMQNGDCRETMYLNGSLFACWQQREVKRLIAKAMLCLELEFYEGFQNIFQKEIPARMRYQLRGGQMSIYVESIAMSTKYVCERSCIEDATALCHPYGMKELLAGQPLSHYELENSKIEVTYGDGSTTWIEPKDPVTGTRHPIDHVPVAGGGIPVIPHSGTANEKVKAIRLLNLVEEHAMTFLYDTQQQTLTFCDGFYNEALFDSPYTFGNGSVVLEDKPLSAGLISAGSRVLRHADGSLHKHPVYIEFLPFSQTDYDVVLMESDIPGTILLMGRSFHGDLSHERHCLKEGISPIPALLEKIQDWQVGQQDTAALDRKTIEKRIARMIMDLARSQSDHVHMQETDGREPLIREDAENNNVYLVLSGQLQVYRRGKSLCDDHGTAIVIKTGGIVGELSALSGKAASATVAGEAVVLGIAMPVVQQQLKNDPAFRDSMTELAGYRIY